MSNQSCQRKIIHIDADCFFAGLEVRDNPGLAGKPVAVGGSADRRGVISTCNYEARRFGVHSAMASARALALCPQLLILPPRFEVYKQASRQMHKIFRCYTSEIEPLSLDEAFLDVSESPHFNGSATRIAQAIRADVQARVGITVSAGVAPNKFLAKVASDWRKPNGLYVITPEQVPSFVATLPVGKIIGVGKVTNQKLQRLGVKVCSDLQKLEKSVLTEQFGRFGLRLFQMCRGIDARPVCAQRQRKSVSVEHTYPVDLVGPDQCLAHIDSLYGELARRLKGVVDPGAVSGCFVKIKFSDFSVTTLARTGLQPAPAVYAELMSEALVRHNLPVRLLGLGVKLKVNDFNAGSSVQLPLF